MPCALPSKIETGVTGANIKNFTRTDTWPNGESGEPHYTQKSWRRGVSTNKKVAADLPSCVYAQNWDGN